MLVGIVVSVIQGATAKAAAEPAAPVIARLDLESKADCTTREELLARIAARSQRIRFEPEARGGGPTLRATIAPGSGGSVVADLTILSPGGKRAARRIVARGCAEATDALALVITIALDPSFVASASPAATDSAKPAPEEERTPLAPPPRPPPPPAPAEVPTVVAPAIAVPSPAGASPAGASPPPSPPAPSVPRFGAGVFATAVFGPSPAALLGFGVEASAALDRASIWAPSIGLRAAHTSRSGLVETGGTAGFSFDTIALDLCPVRVRLASLQARGCGAALAGVLSASGSNTYSPRSSARPFVTAGGSLLVTVDLGRRLVASARSSLGASLIRDAFQFTPEVFHRISSVTLGLDLGLGLRFP